MATTLIETDLLKMMLFANPGMGKTVVLGSATDDPRLGNQLLVDFEANIVSIRSKLYMVTMEDLENPEFKPTPSKIGRLHVKKWSELQKLLDLFYSETPPPFQTLLVDSITEINYMSLSNCTADNYDKAIRKGKEAGDGVKPLIGDYGDSSAEMQKLVREFRDLDLNVIFTAHAVDTKDEQTGVPDVVPKLTGKLQSGIPAMLHVVGYMRPAPRAANEKKAREIAFQPTPKLSMVKNQFEGSEMDVITVELGDPTLSMILDGLGIAKPEAAPTKAKTAK